MTMTRYPVARVVVRCIIAAGIFLSLLMAGAAPSDFVSHIPPVAPTPTQP